MPADFDKLRLAIKGQLKKDNPKLSEDDLDSRSFAIATSQWKKTHGGKAPSIEIVNREEKFDIEGRLIVGENVKMFIDSTISAITE